MIISNYFKLPNLTLVAFFITSLCLANHANAQIERSFFVDLNTKTVLGRSTLPRRRQLTLAPDQHLC